MLFNPLMRPSVRLLVAACLLASQAWAQEFVPAPPAETPPPEQTPQATPPPPEELLEQSPEEEEILQKPREQPRRKRSWLSRLLNPFGSSNKRVAPEYQDPKIRGLVLDLQISPQTVRLSEVRQLEVKLTVTNIGKRTASLDFAKSQRIEILLKNSAGTVLTRWSDNRVITDTPATLLVNPSEHVEYNETIATRELAPNKVFIVEVFFPRYPELRIRQKFLAAP